MTPPLDPTPPAPEPAPTPKPRRRRWRLSVRGLMVLVLLVGGLIGWEASRVARLRRAVATLERPVVISPDDLGKYGGVPDAAPRKAVHVDYADLLGTVAWLRRPWVAEVVGWVRRSVGDDHFRRVDGLEFDHRPTAEDWDAVVALGTVERLEFADLAVTAADLARLPQCVSLRELDLSGTPVDDQALAIVGTLPRLRALRLDSTQTSSDGLAALAGLHDLEEMTLRDDVDADAVLVHLGRLRNLRSLVAGRVSDRGLAALRENAHLDILSFAAWNVTDAGWAVVAGFHDLKDLRIGAGWSDFGRTPFGRHESEWGRPTTLSPAAVRQLGQLTNLEKLACRGVGDATWLPPLKSLARLRDLDIDGDWVDDAALIAVGNLALLERLNVSGDRITDAGLAPLGRLAYLEELGISSPRVTDAGLAHLQPLTNLVDLNFSAGAGPAHIENPLKFRGYGIWTMRLCPNSACPFP